MAHARHHRVRTCLPQRLDPPESDRGSIDHPAQRAADPGTAALVAIQAGPGSHRRRRGWSDRDPGDEPDHAAGPMDRAARHPTTAAGLGRVDRGREGSRVGPGTGPPTRHRARASGYRRHRWGGLRAGLASSQDAGFPRPLVGLGFGSALWAFNYIVAAPALDLFPPPWKDRPGRPPVMLAANALFGLVTAHAGRHERTRRSSRSGRDTCEALETPAGSR